MVLVVDGSKLEEKWADLYLRTDSLKDAVLTLMMEKGKGKFYCMAIREIFKADMIKTIRGLFKQDPGTYSPITTLKPTLRRHCRIVRSPDNSKPLPLCTPIHPQIYLPATSRVITTSTHLASTSDISLSDTEQLTSGTFP